MREQGSLNGSPIITCLPLSYQNFNKIVNNETKSIKFDNLKTICDILECTPNDLFEEYYGK